MQDNNILAVVLAGGKSQRFGEDKNHIKLGDKTLLEHVLYKISDKFYETLIVSSHTLKIQKTNRMTIIPDCLEDFGPLAGVLSSMKWIKENQKTYRWIATFPSDTPFFTKKELKYFYDNIKINESKLFFIKTKKTRHNIFGLWSLELKDQLEDDILKGERKVEDWANSVGVNTVDIDYKKIDPFFNINTEKDLKKASKIIQND